MNRLNVITAGFAYTDIVATVDNAFFERNSIPVNTIVSMNANVLRRLQYNLSQAVVLPGGASANSASVVSALGGKAGFFGKIANDSIGDSFLEAFTKAGVELCCPIRDVKFDLSATCMILLDQNGQRSMVYNPGAAEQFLASDFEDFNYRSADFFLVESQLLSSARAAPVIRQAIERAKEQTRIVINLQEIQNRKPFKALLPWVAAHADILIGNEVEFQAVNKLIRLPHMPKQILVMTKGKDGAEAWAEEGHVQVPSISPKTFVNTVGAGDAFAAGLLYSLSNKQTLEQSLHRAARVAAAMIGESGGRPSGSLAQLGLL